MRAAAEGVEGFKAKTVAGVEQEPVQPARTDGLGWLDTAHAHIMVVGGDLCARWHTLG